MSNVDVAESNIGQFCNAAVKARHLNTGRKRLHFGNRYSKFIAF